MIAGVLAVLSAAALMLIIWSSEGGLLYEPDATVRQRTVDVIVQTRLAATAQMRATLTAEVTADAAATEDGAP
jgi:hypothetical protein